MESFSVRNVSDPLLIVVVIVLDIPSLLSGPLLGPSVPAERPASPVSMAS